MRPNSNPVSALVQASAVCVPAEPKTCALAPCSCALSEARQPADYGVFLLMDGIDSVWDALVPTRGTTTGGQRSSRAQKAQIRSKVG